MTTRSDIDLTDEDKTVLASWRNLIETHYFEDIQRLSHYTDDVFGLEVEHSDLAKDDELNAMFHARPFHCLMLGNMVLREQFNMAGVQMRGAIRVVRLSEEYRNSIEELRMRNRNTIVTVDVKVVSMSEPYGWLKIAKYRCRDCNDEVIINQRRARERESPRFCKSCLQKSREADNDEEHRLFAIMHSPNFAMELEECYYEDAQNMMIRHVSHDSEGNAFSGTGLNTQMAIVSDELVGGMDSSEFYRLNGVVKVEPLRDRNFLKDTRRVLVVDVFSAEALDLKE